MTGTEGDDDRRAILARRRRFIALTLAGLGGSACSPRKGESEPPEQADTEGEGETEASPSGVDPIDMPPPRPPKEIPRTRRKWTVPQSCLRVHLPDDDAP